MQQLGQVINLNIQGLGIIVYSPPAALHIVDGENYFKSQYNTGDDVLRHVKEGSIVGFCTGSSGKFVLSVLNGYPPQDVIHRHEFKIRLGIHVRGGLIVFRDLYDLMSWRREFPPNQSVKIADGFYHITLCTNVPPSGVLGDRQEILAYFNALEKMPELNYAGAPILCE